MADNQTFNLKIVAPEGIIAERSVSSVQLPGADGEIGVLPRHCNYTGLLKAGMVRIDSESFEIRGGFARFADNTLTVLAD